MAAPNKTGALGPIVALKLRSAPGAKGPSRSGYGPPSSLELMAAKSLIAAVASGNPGQVVESYRAMKDACENAKAAEPEGDEGGY